MYKGVYYRQGQTWQDGCDKICTCDDVTNNLYSCRSRFVTVFFFYQIIKEKNVSLEICDNNKMIVIVRINYNQHLQKGNIKLASTVQWE